jgi:methionyl aminopeptidase
MQPLRSNDVCWCGSSRKLKRCHGDRKLLQRSRVELGTVSPERFVPDTIARPDYVDIGNPGTSKGRQIQDADSLERLRHACAVAAEVLLRSGGAVAPAVTTDELDVVAHETYISLGAYPSTLHYGGSRDYPKSICTSVNGVICHGIPDDRPLEQGDIVNIDVTAYIDGMHGDTSATFIVGDVDEPTRALVETTREATLLGIQAVGPGVKLRAIGDAIEPFARSRGFGVVRDYGGHGIGETFHAAPHINHCVTSSDNATFETGMTFTIEPMLTTGSDRYEQAGDGWTEHTLDAMPSAQFEHTVVVTDDSAEILTVTKNGEMAMASTRSDGFVR